MTADRRDFLKQLSVGGIAAVALPSTAMAAATAPSTPPLAEIAAMLSPADPPTFDTSWTARLTTKHRAVFDVPEINGGSGVFRAGLWVQHYVGVLQARPAEMQPVLVIRSKAIPLVMTQEYWLRYAVADRADVRHPMTDEKTKRNPALMTAVDDGLPPGLATLALDEQMKRGTIVLACNMAFALCVQTIADHDKLSPADARKKALEMMLPGVILQPNGIFGVVLAQQHGCAFVAAA
ncbi:MAG: twin-arginine translocation signal domain-containing protein [Gemmatimonadaceae bacterium]|nr:twin-arginine translocation signal domain-containing protein [Gemmatimonadaceae bacterium]